MNNWERTCQEQLARLEKTVILADKLSDLCDKARAELPADISQTIHEERPRLQRQLDRLRANRFEVAVIGLEKAGKSALLNAWLGQEILPSAAERCTYTTTEIWSAPTESEQELRIEYFSRQEIDTHLREKREEQQNYRPGSRDHDDLHADIKETEQHLNAIYDYARQGSSSRPFRDIDEIREDLQQAVFKNRAQARAIKRIQLKTTRLRSDRDIVFHDVPGFDSPVVMHKAQAEQKLAECDAILYAKKIDNPNINSPEKNMLQVADVEDKHVKVADKVFVVLTKADMARDASELNDWLGKHRRDWQDVPESRLVPVCAAAHLANLGTGSPETNQLGVQSIQKLAQLEVDDGIQRLKQSVDQYIDHDRIQVLSKRCDALVSVFTQQARKLCDHLTPAYPQAKQDNAHEHELYGEDFGKWWGPEWSSVQKSFKNWYTETIDCREGTDGAAGEHAKLTELHETYNSKVDELFDRLQTIQVDEMERLYKAASPNAPIPSRGNRDIRDALYPEIQQVLQQELPTSLAGSLQAMIDEVVEQAKQLLYGIDDIRNGLIQDPEQVKQRVQHGFETLFLRFGRVAVDVFVQYPLKDRQRILDEDRYRAEIQTLEAFYKGQNPARTNLSGYLQMGVWAIQMATDVGVLPPIAAKAVKAANQVTTPDSGSIADMLKIPSTDTRLHTETPPPAHQQAPEPQNFQEVQREIEHDLDVLKDYLKNSVFYAAGFIVYSQQELRRIRDRFVALEDDERRWDHIIRREVRRQNPAVPFKIADRMQKFQQQREIALQLADVKDVLGKLN